MLTGVPCLQKLQAVRQSSDQDRTKLERRFKERLKEMDVKMKELHRKEKQFCQLERLKARSEDTCARLNSDILSIKQQKVSSLTLRSRAACAGSALPPLHVLLACKLTMHVQLCLHSKWEI